jgi:ABC-type lipoprotein release transport system permease subunit
VGTLVSVTGFYETARRGIRDEIVTNWLGSAHLSIEPPGAHWGRLEASLAAELASIEGVAHVTARLKRRMLLIPEPESEQLVADLGRLVDAIGIDPRTELDFRKLPGLTGRMFTAEETGVAVIETETARARQVAIGDTIHLAILGGGAWMPLTVVGTYDSVRLAEFQKPVVYVPLADVQRIHRQVDAASVIEIMLSDPTQENLAATQVRIEALIKERNLPYRVESGARRQALLSEAERITELALVLVAGVSMIASLGIIVTTMGMSLYERRTNLGVMRCVGATRGQIVGLLLAELIPLGMVGTASGVALGVWGTRFVGSLESVDLPTVYFSRWGLGLGVASGLITVLICGLILAFQIGRVSPLDAVRVEARPARMRWVAVCAAAGAALIALYEWMRATSDAGRWLETWFALTGAVALYIGYMMLAPAVVMLIGRPIARGIAPLLRLNGTLAQDQFGKAPWRSAGTCWMLMVGLSLIVFVAMRARAIHSVWSFPDQLPEAFVWSKTYVSGESVSRVVDDLGLDQSTVLADLNCEIVPDRPVNPDQRGGLLERFLKRFTRPVFVAGDPEKLLRVMRLGFAEGDLDDALAKLARGGYVLIPTQTARQHELHLDDRVKIVIDGKEATFIVAGVIQAPALDVAVTFFQAESYLQFAAASAVFGTRADLRERFDRDVVSLLMFNMRMAQTPPPAMLADGEPVDFTDERAVARLLLESSPSMPEHGAALAGIEGPLRAYADGGETLSGEAAAWVKRLALVLRRASWRYDGLSPEDRWASIREEVFLGRIVDQLGGGESISGSLRRLREGVERSWARATAILTWMPSYVLLAAAIGIANLITVSVHSRSRQIAVLRAIGAQGSQIMRLVLAEALTLGALGSVLGVTMGVHAAYGENEIIGDLIGVYGEFIIPTGTVLAAVGLTLAVCLLAGIAPARRASRSDIVQAMQTT